MMLRYADPQQHQLTEVEDDDNKQGCEQPSSNDVREATAATRCGGHGCVRDAFLRTQRRPPPACLSVSSSLSSRRSRLMAHRRAAFTRQTVLLTRRRTDALRSRGGLLECQGARRRARVLARGAHRAGVGGGWCVHTSIYTEARDAET